MNYDELNESFPDFPSEPSFLLLQGKKFQQTKVEIFEQELSQYDLDELSILYSGLKKAIDDADMHYNNRMIKENEAIEKEIYLRLKEKFETK